MAPPKVDPTSRPTVPDGADAGVPLPRKPPPPTHPNEHTSVSKHPGRRPLDAFVAAPALPQTANIKAALKLANELAPLIAGRYDIEIAEKRVHYSGPYARAEESQRTRSFELRLDEVPQTVTPSDSKTAFGSTLPDTRAAAARHAVFGQWQVVSETPAQPPEFITVPRTTGFHQELFSCGGLDEYIEVRDVRLSGPGLVEARGWSSHDADWHAGAVGRVSDPDDWPQWVRDGVRAPERGAARHHADASGPIGAPRRSAPPVRQHAAGALEA